MTLTTESGLDGEYVPSPVERVRKQVADYEAGGGVEGRTVEGRPVVILTSVGAKSGKLRKNQVMRIVDGDRYVTVASAGGSPTNPSWYTNVVAHPRVRLHDGASVKEFDAREVTGDEKRYYWAVAEGFWPHFPEYRRLAGGRDIPIMVLEPIGAYRGGRAMGTAAEERNKAFVLDAFDTLANRRDYAAAELFWSRDYIQHSAHIPPGRDGLFNLVKAAPPDRRYENALTIADGDYVMLHGRMSTSGPRANRIAVDIVRLEDGLIAEHWDVVQDEATAEESKSGLPMFGGTFPTRP
ncbi:MAG: deazaflavin-dependent nitroreductase family protein [Mycobacterium sp.]|jgi:deazaflavin-dependent oxidoreductase (nitroreductase family)|nr:deazaflavin-dependent nitroreductase family protein [Mycobacterium sp.]